jgi:hypothetical protein
LASFVGVLVAVTAGTLIGVGYYFTSEIVRDQVHTRLSLVATDRQDMLLSGLRQHEERAVLFASRARIRRLLEDLADHGQAVPPRRGRAKPGRRPHQHSKHPRGMGRDAGTRGHHLRRPLRADREIPAVRE